MNQDHNLFEMLLKYLEVHLLERKITIFVNGKGISCYSGVNKT